MFLRMNRLFTGYRPYPSPDPPTLRHAFVTNVRRAGIPDVVIMKTTGHKTDSNGEVLHSDCPERYIADAALHGICEL